MNREIQFRIFTKKDNSIQQCGESDSEGHFKQFGVQRHLGPPIARQHQTKSKDYQNVEVSTSNTWARTERTIPWSVDRECKMATEIMAVEVMKLITKAYEDVFEDSQDKNMRDMSNREGRQKFDILSS